MKSSKRKRRGKTRPVLETVGADVIAEMPVAVEPALETMNALSEAAVEVQSANAVVGLSEAAVEVQSANALSG